MLPQTNSLARAQSATAYDCPLPPPPAEMDHYRAIRLYQFHCYKGVMQIGQIAICPDPDLKHLTHFLEIWSKCEVAVRYQGDQEDKSATKATNQWMARELSRLTHWKLSSSFSQQQRHVVDARIERIVQISYQLVQSHSAEL